MLSGTLAGTGIKSSPIAYNFSTLLMAEQSQRLMPLRDSWKRGTSGTFPNASDHKGVDATKGCHSLVRGIGPPSEKRRSRSPLNGSGHQRQSNRPVIRTPAEGVGRDSRRLGLRID